MTTADKILSELNVILGLIEDLSLGQVKLVLYIILGGWTLEDALDIVHKYAVYKEKG